MRERSGMVACERERKRERERERECLPKQSENSSNATTDN